MNGFGDIFSRLAALRNTGPTASGAQGPSYSTSNPQMGSLGHSMYQNALHSAMGNNMAFPQGGGAFPNAGIGALMPYFMQRHNLMQQQATNPRGRMQINPFMNPVSGPAMADLWAARNARRNRQMPNMEGGMNPLLTYF